MFIAATGIIFVFVFQRRGGVILKYVGSHPAAPLKNKKHRPVMISINIAPLTRFLCASCRAGKDLRVVWLRRHLPGLLQPRPHQFRQIFHRHGPWVQHGFMVAAELELFAQLPLDLLA